MGLGDSNNSTVVSLTGVFLKQVERKLEEIEVLIKLNRRNDIKERLEELSKGLRVFIADLRTSGASRREVAEVQLLTNNLKVLQNELEGSASSSKLLKLLTAARAQFELVLG